MDYGSIIKRSFNITWRYKALWVLGIFAGISGCQAGGGSNGGSGGRNTQGGSPSQQGFDQLNQALDFLRDRWEILAGLAAGLMVIWFLWSIIAIAARGGLVVAVNSADERGSISLSEAWSAGFSKWWSLLGLHLLFKLPILVLALGTTVAVLVPIARTLIDGNEPGPEIAVPVCGALLMIPVIAVLALVLDPLFLTALRYLMLGGQGAMDAARNSWAFLRSRLKDTAVMYVLLAVLNTAAGILIALFAIAIGGTVGASIAFGVLGSRSLAPLTGMFALASVLLFAIIMVYNAVWGTFTSTLWTLFFREVTGMFVPVPAPAPAYATQSPQYPTPPPQAPYEAPTAPAPALEPPAAPPPAPEPAAAPMPAPEPEPPAAPAPEPEPDREPPA